MVIKEIEDLKSTIKLLEVNINSLSGIAEDVDIDTCYKALQNLVFQVQYKANAIGEGVAPLIRHKKATFNSQGVDYVQNLLAEESKPEVEVEVEVEPEEKPEEKLEVEDKTEESEESEEVTHQDTEAAEKDVQQNDTDTTKEDKQDEPVTKEPKEEKTEEPVATTEKKTRGRKSTKK